MTAKAAKSDPWQMIDKCPSKASWTDVECVTKRMDLKVTRGQYFPSANGEVPEFKWESSEERAHYAAAVLWAQNNLCPRGVTAVHRSTRNVFNWCAGVGVGVVGVVATALAANVWHSCAISQLALASALQEQ